MLGQRRWPDAGPTLSKHWLKCWFNIVWLPGLQSCFYNLENLRSGPTIVWLVCSVCSSIETSVKLLTKPPILLFRSRSAFMTGVLPHKQSMQVTTPNTWMKCLI